MVDTFEGEVIRCLNDERGIYSKILELTPTYMESQKHEESLSMADQASKDDEKSATLSEVKALATPPKI